MYLSYRHKCSYWKIVRYCSTLENSKISDQTLTKLSLPQNADTKEGIWKESTAITP